MAVNSHVHKWKVRYKNIYLVDYFSGMECECGKILEVYEVKNLVNAHSECAEDFSSMINHDALFLGNSLVCKLEKLLSILGD